MIFLFAIQNFRPQREHEYDLDPTSPINDSDSDSDDSGAEPGSPGGPGAISASTGGQQVDTAASMSGEAAASGSGGEKQVEEVLTNGKYATVSVRVCAKRLTNGAIWTDALCV